MTKTTIKIYIKILSFFILTFFFLPLLTYADGLVICNGVDAAGNATCGFKELMLMIPKVTNFIFYYLAVPFFAVLFAYAGFTLLTSGGNAEAASKARGMLLNAVVGFLIAICAWIIIKFIMQVLLFDEVNFKTFFN